MIGRFHLPAFLRVALLLAVTFYFVVANVSTWRTRGWSGMAYFGEKMDAAAYGFSPGKIQAVLPHEAAERSNIKAGSLVLAVNGIPLSEHEKLRSLAQRTWVGEFVHYRIADANGAAPHDVVVRQGSAFHSTKILVSLLSSLFCGLVFLTIALIVIWTRRGDRRAVVFHWMCLVGAGFFFTNNIFSFPIESGQGVAPLLESSGFVAFYTTYVVLTLVMTDLLLHLALIFPEDHPLLTRRPLILRWLYAISFFPVVGCSAIFALLALSRQSIAAAMSVAILAMIAALALLLRGRGEERWGRLLQRRPVGSMSLLVALLLISAPLLRLFAPRSITMVGGAIAGGTAFVTTILVFAYSVFTIGVLISSYRRSSTEQRRQLRWPLWGTAMALSVVTFLSLSFMILTELFPEWVGENYALASAVQVISRVAYLLIPVSFAFGIVKYRLMHVDRLIQKTVVYAVLSGVLLASYAGLVVGVGSMLMDRFRLQGSLVTATLTLLIAALLVPLRNRLQHSAERLVFPDRFEVPDALLRLDEARLSAASLGDYGRVAASVVHRTLRSRWVALGVLDDERERMLPMGAQGLTDTQIELLRIPVHRAARCVERFTSLDHLDDSPDSRRLGHAVAVPLRQRGELIGLLLIGLRRPLAELEEEERNFLEKACDPLARGVDELRVSREEYEFEQARAIQQRLLPSTPPKIEGLEIAAAWQPAREVGGDYYDLIALPSGSLAFCIADVAGKGLPAAMVTASLHAAVRAVVDDRVSTADVVRRVGNVLRNALTGGRFVTMFFAVFDPLDCSLRYTNAGHYPPLLIRANGESIPLSSGSGAVARLFADIDVREERMLLREGDRLVLFTDGITEARDATEELFGEQRLAETIRATFGDCTSLRDQILSTLQSFSGNQFDDDLTLVCLRVGAVAESRLREAPAVTTVA